MIWITGSFVPSLFPRAVQSSEGYSATIWRDLGKHRRQLAEGPDAAQALRLRPARLHHAPRAARDVDGLQAGLQGGQHVVVDALADIGDFFGSTAGFGNQALEEGLVRLGDAP